MALYRKYRPASFAEVVGQEQVTRPLSVALDSGRINHAYLFSGPRGCGKTSSARILARSLNCVNGPTSQPCGVCPSCISLAPGGPGNLDVTELDAASHNGVDEMRELRDRAYYAPAESRYRVFIIDEAHMISNAGFNALLKIVEEPPEHLIFIFATTEPDKLIGTIRSRVHHYPFRLLTPPDMRALLERTCGSEGVRVEDSVYPLVIRAGGGSPRDSLSILDQLLAGSGPDGLTYAEAVPLLGVTDTVLIDAAVNALADHDHAALFTCVDDVINAGHDPRRFATDLLDRLRDLMIMQSVPDALTIGLVDAPADHHPELLRQASLFNSRTIAALANQLNDQIEDLRGATSPRLLLEIMCARMMLVATGQQVDSAAAAAAGQVTPATEVASPPAGGERPRYQRKSMRQTQQAPAAPATPAPAAAAPPAPAAAQPPTAPPSPRAATQAPAPAPKPQDSAPAVPTAVQEPARATTPAPTAATAPAPKTAPPAPAAPTAPSTATTGEDPLAQVRSQWAEIRRVVGESNQVAAIMLTEAKVLGIKDSTLVVGHNTGALADRLNATGNNATLMKAVSTVLGKNYEVKVVVGTNPEAAGLPAQGVSQPKEQWNPSKPQAAPRAATSSAPAPEAPSAATPSESDEPADPEPAQPAPPARSGWGAPAPIGQELKQESTPASTQPPAPRTFAAPPPSASVAPPPPAPTAAPEKKASPQEAKPVPRWKQAAERGRAQLEKQQASSFSDGVPLPPEPGFEEEPPEDWQGAGQPGGASISPAPVPESEEEEMIEEAAKEPANYDHRDSRTIAMEMLQAELGARQL